MINVLIVTTDASYISTQKDDWKAAVDWVLEKADLLSSEMLYGRINGASPVFFKDQHSSSRMEQHTIASIVKDRKAGEI